MITDLSTSTGLWTGQSTTRICNTSYSSPSSASFPLVDLSNESETVAGPSEDPLTELSATDLTKWLPETILSSARNLLRPVLLFRLTPPEPIKLAATVTDNDSHRSEAVSEINGLAIPAMLEARCKPRMSLSQQEENGQESEQELAVNCPSSMYIQLLAASQDSGDKMHPAIKKRFKSLPLPSADNSCEYFLELAALYLAGACPSSKGYISKVIQIKSFDWLAPSQAHSCLQVLSDAVSDSSDGAYFEYGLQEVFSWMPGNKAVELLGVVDILTPTVLWEVKCVSQLSDVHFLQLAVYAWLWKRTKQVRGSLLWEGHR